MNFYFSNYLMEKLNLKETTIETNQIKEDNQSNQLESPLTDKYDSATESQPSDQSDLENGNDKKDKQSTNDLSSRILNLSLHDHGKSNGISKQFRSKSNSLREDDRTNEQIKLSQVQGQKSDDKILIAHTKERITQMFDMLEKQTGLKLKKSGLNFNNNNHNSEETLTSLIDESNGRATDQSSPELVNYANSHDSESVSSFETKNKKISVEQVKEQAGIKLEFKLQKAEKELKLRDEEIAKLSRIRHEVELELEDLTASLFEEANKMVQEAKYQKSKSDKALKEATMKNDVLLAEVKALKVLVRNSIPSSLTNSSTNRQNSFKSNRSTSSNQSNNLSTKVLVTT